ncbi:hypothetical protein OQA88_8064 [Cercophora sp. LCS_1]
MGDEEVPWRDPEGKEAGLGCSLPDSDSCSLKGKGKEKADDTQHGPIFSLPTELIHQIFLYLSAFELIAVSKTCRAFHTLANSDHLWHALVQANVPGARVISPSPLPTFRALYAAHDPHWFLTKHQIWFSDVDLTGRLIIVEYDQRRGCMEGYQLVAVSHAEASQPWEVDPRVTIHDFQPKVALHLDRPVLRLAANTPEILAQEEAAHEAIKVIDLRERDADNFTQRAEPNPESEDAKPKSFNPETRMRVGYDNSMHSSFMLVRPATQDNHALNPDEYPYAGVWPPPGFPTEHRVQGHDPYRIITAADGFHLPESRSEISEYGFRIKKWLEMRVSLGFMHEQNIFTEVLFHARYPAPIAGMEISTFSTLDPKLYTPTADKPFRGIWVGDYSAHGCEFLLIHQPDDTPDTRFDEENFARLGNESNETFNRRKNDARIYRGELKAIKLTGDPNVPRGEYTFLVENLGQHSICQDEPFVGAKVVRSKGHIANHGFEDDEFINSQLFLISHNRLAQHWHEFHHISFFDRVDLDQFLKPTPR